MTISGSPTKNANTDKLVKAILNATELEGVVAELLHPGRGLN
jgi:multimeric flavodoxin WrbA